MEAAVWGLVGTIVGASASICTTGLQLWNERRLHRDSSSQELTERRRAFQRDTLTEFQDVFHDLVRIVTRAYLEDLQNYRKHGTWGTHQLSDEVSDGERVLRRRLLILKSRINNDDLRREADAMSELLNQLTFAQAKEDAERLHQRCVAEATRLVEMIGTELRAQY